MSGVGYRNKQLYNSTSSLHNIYYYFNNIKGLHNWFKIDNNISGSYLLKTHKQ